MIRRFLFGGFALLVLAAMTWPGYETFGARVEPFVLGLPFSLAWVVGWVLLTFVGLTAFHVTRRESG